MTTSHSKTLWISKYKLNSRECKFRFLMLQYHNMILSVLIKKLQLKICTSNISVIGNKRFKTTVHIKNKQNQHSSRRVNRTAITDSMATNNIENLYSEWLQHTADLKSSWFINSARIHVHTRARTHVIHCHLYLTII